MKDFLKIFGFFWTKYRKETVFVAVLIFFAGLVEALGVAAFLPFFQIILNGHASAESLPPGRLRDFIAESGITIDFKTVSIFIVAVIVTKAAILWVSLRKVSVTVSRIAADLRTRLLQALLHARWGFFVHHSLGTSLNAIINESFRASMAFVSLARFISAMVQFAVYAAGAYLLSHSVFVGAILIGGMLATALWSLVKVARRAGQQQTILAKDMLNQLAEMLQGIKPVRAMALENDFMQLLSGHSRGLEKSQADQLVTGQAMRIFHEPLMVMTAVGGLFLIMTYGHLTTSELAMMAVIFIRLLNSMNAAQNEYQRLMIQESALWSLLETIEETEKAADAWPGTGGVPTEIKTIELRDVGFSHGERAILSAASLDFAPRTMTALIGESGSGKTTILDLLSGFYRPAEGVILVNGRDLSDFDLREWRRSIGFVPQEVFLFNDTIFENICVGRSGISQDDVWTALTQAGAKEFVESLPEKLNISVGENGRRLSGGQRQRIAIARAIVHKPQVLLLDEATSALDQQTEQVLLQTLQTLARDMTVIFVSHNAAVQDYADAVYSIAGGKVEKRQKSAVKRKA